MSKWRLHTSVFAGYMEGLILAVVLAFLVRAFVVSSGMVTTDSMAPGLMVGDLVMSYKLPFGIPLSSRTRVGFVPPKRGQVVTVRLPRDHSVVSLKRVVAVAGDRVLISARGQLAVNGKMAEYTQLTDGSFQERFSGTAYSVFLGQETGETLGPYVVPEGHVFLLNDNRVAKEDSRSWGWIPSESLIGRAVFLGASFDWEGGGIRWGRTFRSVH